jgi:hypothetical protein
MPYPNSFPVTPELTAIAIAYRNKTLIADDVLPRVIVPTADFKYQLFSLAEGFTVPDTKVGRRSAPNEVVFSASEATASVVDYGLSSPVPNSDIEAANNTPYDPLGRATEQTMNLLMLDREVRAAALVFATGSYAGANQATLSGTGQWSDFTNSNPLSAIMDALDTMVMRPNIGVFGRATWTKLRQHPRIVEAVRGTGAGINAQGVVNRREVADLLELEDIYVGEGFLNTAKKGQTPTTSRVWGKHASFIYRDSLADASVGTTFGFTGQWGSRVAGSEYDKNIGLRGGQEVRVGESVKELITANDLGYFFQNAVA